MKRLAIFALTILSLSGCSLTQEMRVQGEVVNCLSIDTKPTNSPILDCLDGSPGVAVDSIVGPVLVNVWGTWCQPCLKELPHLAHYLAKEGSLKIIGIAVEEKSSSRVKEFVENHGISWPILYDSNGSTREKFGMGVPVTWFIDASGNVAFKKFGPYSSVEEIELDVTKYLGEK